MKQIKLTFLSALLILASASFSQAQTTFPVAIDNVINGSVKLSPELPANGQVPQGTVITVTTTPNKGFSFDGGYYSTKANGRTINHEVMSPVFKVTVDQEINIGASFVEKSKVDHIKVTENVVYAQPGVKPLKYDVYSPKGAKNLPCIVIIHGGGWSSNSEDVMRGMARELTKDGKYVVFSIDYRWVRQLDGDQVGNSMADLVDDVFGAIAHIMEHAREYGGDPSRIAVTGDSAGGHLSAVAGTMPNKIGRGGYGKTPGVFEFMPSYIPKNKTVEQVREEMMAAIQAAAPSYGVFGGDLLNHYSDNPAADNTWKDGIAPLTHIPKSTERQIPHYLIRGTNDRLIKDESVKVYVDSLVSAGQRVEYVQVGGANHAFLDWKVDTRTKETFNKYAVYYISQMERFFDSVFYKGK